MKLWSAALSRQAPADPGWGSPGAVGTCAVGAVIHARWKSPAATPGGAGTESRRRLSSNHAVLPCASISPALRSLACVASAPTLCTRNKIIVYPDIVFVIRLSPGLSTPPKARGRDTHTHQPGRPAATTPGIVCRCQRPSVALFAVRRAASRCPILANPPSAATAVTPIATRDEAAPGPRAAPCGRHAPGKRARPVGDSPARTGRTRCDTAVRARRALAVTARMAAIGAARRQDPGKRRRNFAVGPGERIRRRQQWSSSPICVSGLMTCADPQYDDCHV